MSDLNDCACRLIDFALQSVDDGLAATGANATLCLEEADETIRVLMRLLQKQDTLRNGQLMLIGVFETSFASIHRIQDEHQRMKLFTDAREQLQFAKTLFS